MVEAIKTLINGLMSRVKHDVEKAKSEVLAVASKQSDWNQNDENAVDYVKNRTHWIEKTKREEIFNSGEITITGIYYDSSQFYYSFEYGDLWFEQGDQYIIEVGSYVVISTAESSSSLQWKDANNINWGVRNNGNGFCVFYGANSGETSVPFTTTLKISHMPKEIYHPLDPKFIPESIKLPSVTSTDSGKFLRVSSTGEWTAEAVTNAEEVTY